jgi:predicted dehydrogenase
MPTTPLRVALIGLDHWYTAIPLVTEISAHPDLQLVGIADADPGRATEVAARAGDVKVTTNADELIGDPTVDIVASLTSSDRNAEVCVAAAEAGKHLLSVKPFARTLDDAARIVEAVRRAGVVFLPAESRSRVAALYRQLRQWLDDGRIGEVLTASFSLWSSLPRRWTDVDEPGWFADPARVPGGAWIDHSIYQLDLLRWLLGAEARSISGVVATRKYPDLAVEDYGLAVVTFTDGVVARVEDTWLAPPGSGRSALSLVGRTGAIAYDSLSGRLSLVGSSEPYDGWVHLQPPAAMASGLDELVGAVRGTQEPLATVADAWHNLAACVAFYESAASGSPVTPAALPSA